MEIRARCVWLALALIFSVCGFALRPQAGIAATHSGSGSHCIYDHLTLRTAPRECRPHARAYPPKIHTSVERAIYDASLIFGVPYSILRHVAQCESSLNPRAAAGGHYGVFQFDPETFRVGAGRLRRDTGIVAHSYWKPLDSSYVAGYLFATGKAPSWSCEYS